MKNDKGISRIALILIIVLILVIGTVTVVFIINKNNKTGEETKTEIPNKTQDVEKSDGTSDEVIQETTGKTFWLNSIEWSKQNNNIDLYNNKISLPIKLENLDVCSAPYSFWPDGVNQTNAETIQDILKSTTEINAGRETQISTQRKYVDGSWKDYDEVPDNIESIYIKNYTEAVSTTAECYNNGWWYITNKYNLDDVLGVDLTNNTEYRKDWDESPLLDMAIDKFGSPTYIGMLKNYSDNLKSNEGMIIYDLVYEYNEYTITFSVSEMIMSEYDSQTIKFGRITYYTKECWEKEKNETADNIEIIKK